MVKRPYLPEADLVRAAAIIAVVAVHVTSVPITSLSTDSSLYLMYLTINTFGKLGVPTFIFLSGFMLFYSYYPRTEALGWLKHFYRNKLSFVVFPYLAWSFFYHLYSFALRGSIGFDSATFLRQLQLGKASYHLYFMIIIIQFYFLFPFLLTLLKKQEFLARHFFLLSLILQWAFYVYNKYFWQFEYKSRLSLTYFSFFTFGILIAANYDSLVAFYNKRCALGLAFTAWTVALTWNTLLYYNAYTKQIYANGLWFEAAWNIYAFVSFIFLCLLGGYVISRDRGLPIKAASILGQVSFGVYLLHPALLSLLRKIPLNPTSLIYHSTMALQFVLVLTGSCLIVYLLQRYLPLSDFVLGKSKVRN